jgi:L-fucose isomerase-like protein
MNIVITNRANEAVPVLSSDEGGWAEVVEPGTPLTIFRENTDVIIIGDKPDVSEQIKEGLGVVKKAVDKVRETLTAKPKDKGTMPTTDEVNVVIGNNGPNFIRVILGDGKTASDVPVGISYEAKAKGYVEVRELGLLAEDPNQKEAA